MYVTGILNKITLFLFSFLHHWVHKDKLLFFKNTSFARKCSNDDLAFIKELWTQLRKSSLLDSQRRNSSWSTVLPGQFSSLTWWPRRCATGEAWPNIMLSCQAGRPCDVRAHRNRLTTWPPHVITRYFCFLLMQHFDTGKHSYSHGFFLFFWRVRVCWNSFIYWLLDLKKCFPCFKL